MYSQSHVKVIAWISLGLSTEKVKPPTISLTSELRHFQNVKTTIQFDGLFLPQKGTSLTYKKLINVYIVCKVDNWPGYPSNNFTIKSYLFGESM